MLNYKKILRKKLDFILFMLNFKSSFIVDRSTFNVAVPTNQETRKENRCHERGTAFKIENLLDMLKADFEDWIKKENISIVTEKNLIIFSKGKVLNI